MTRRRTAFRFRRQPDRESSSLAIRIADIECAAMRIDDALDDGQTKARAAATAAVCAPETLGHAVTHGSRYAGTAILNAE